MITAPNTKDINAYRRTYRGAPARGDVLLAAWQGRESETRRLVQAPEPELLERGEGGGFVAGQYAMNVLEIGRGHGPPRCRT